MVLNVKTFAQTISIRKFLRELEQDAILLDRQLHASYGKQVANNQVISVTEVKHRNSLKISGQLEKLCVDR